MGMFSTVWIQNNIQTSAFAVIPYYRPTTIDLLENKAVIPYNRPTNVGKRLLVTSSLGLLFPY